jgi:TolB protein
MRLTNGFVAAVAIAGTLLPAAAAQAAYPGTNGRIAFVSDRDRVNQQPSGHSTPEIYTVNADGSGLTRITRNESHESSPAISPDGTRIAYGSDGIWIVGIDGGTPVRIVDEPADQPTWSPDGSRIAYALQFPGQGIAIVNADGSGRTVISTGNDIYPAWSPNGSKIAVWDSAAGSIDVMNPDGSGRVSLHAGLRPSWSPDGSRIAFESANANANGSDIWVMDADGSDAVRITNFNELEAGATEAAWSPDGTKVAFNHWTTEDAGPLHTVNPDGSGLAVIPNTSEGRNDSQPDWGPRPAPDPDPGPGENRPPDCSLVRPSKSVLWPPNRKFHDIFVRGGNIDPDGDHVGIKLTGVTQDERVTGYQDAWWGYWDHEVWLRAEREGRDGRVYRISFKAYDGKGGRCRGVVKVTVPKSKRRPAVDSGRRYDSFKSGSKARRKRAPRR